jgi:hypothetical protein
MTIAEEFGWTVIAIEAPVIVAILLILRYVRKRKL